MQNMTHCQLNAVHDPLEMVEITELAKKKGVKITGTIDALAGHQPYFFGSLKSAMIMSENRGGLTIFAPYAYDKSGGLLVECKTGYPASEGLKKTLKSVVAELTSTTAIACFVCSKIEKSRLKKTHTRLGQMVTTCRAGHTEEEVDFATIDLAGEAEEHSYMLPNEWPILR